MSKTKGKLENTIAETNDELERERRQRADMEKVKRKLEADLKVCVRVGEYAMHNDII